LALASKSAGAVAVRHFPVGTGDLASAYADAHGIEQREAAEALATRTRFSIGRQWPHPAQSNAMTTSGAALAPVLARLSSEISATTDYFEFQRLAGRSPQLRLSVPGSRIAGFANWLSDMLQINVSSEEPALSAPRVLNFLEGMRGGLLKIGNHQFDFAGGRFVLSSNQPATAGAGQSLATRWKSASSQPATVQMIKPYFMAVVGVALVLLAATAGYYYVLAPIEQDSQTSANIYAATLSRMVRIRTDAPTAAEPTLWAKDLLAVGAAMPYDIKLKRIALVAGSPGLGTTLEISGTLPKNGNENLQLIGRFMSRLSASAALRRRVREVGFAGIGEDDTKDSKDTVFKIVGKVPSGSSP
jgi:hypothetical protein